MAEDKRLDINILMHVAWLSVKIYGTHVHTTPVALSFLWAITYLKIFDRRYFEVHVIADSTALH